MFPWPVDIQGQSQKSLLDLESLAGSLISEGAKSITKCRHPALEILPF